MYGNGTNSNLLFCTHDGMSARRAQVERASTEVDAMSEQDILSQSDDELVSSIQRSLSVRVPTLKRDDISYERRMQAVDRADMWGDVASVEVAVFYFEVPYVGEDIIFTMQPSTFNTNPPRGVARGNVLRISVQGQDDAEKLQQQVDSTLDSVDQYLGWHRAMWAGLDAEVANAARTRLAYRRQKLSTLAAAEAGLANLGFKQKNG